MRVEKDWAQMRVIVDIEPAVHIFNFFFPTGQAGCREPDPNGESQSQP